MSSSAADADVLLQVPDLEAVLTALIDQLEDLSLIHI